MISRQRLINFFNTPKLIFICISFTLNILPLLILSPITPLVVLKASNGDTSKASIYSGFAVGIGSLCGFICSPVLGILSDRYGRRPFLLLNVLAVIINLIGLLIVDYTSAIWVTFLSHIVAGCISSTWAMSFVYVADISSIQDRSKSFGFLGASAGIAAICGPAIASGTGGINLSLPIFIGLAISGLNLLFTGFVLPESRRSDVAEDLSFKHVNTYTSFKLLFSKPLVIGLAIGFCLNQICQFGVIGASVLYDKEVFKWDALEIGLSYCLFGLVLFITQGFLIKPTMKYYGERQTILTGILITCLITFPFALVNGWFTFLLIPIKAMSSISTPVIQALISKQYTADVQGKLLGALGGLQTLSGFIGPILFSSLYSYYTSDQASIYFPQIIFYVASGLELIALIIIASFFYKIPDQKIATADEGEAPIDIKIELDQLPPVIQMPSDAPEA